MRVDCGYRWYRRLSLTVILLIACIPLFGLYRWGLGYLLDVHHQWLITLFIVLALPAAGLNLLYTRRRIDKFLRMRANDLTNRSS
jgi:hypothetical protein